MNPLEALADAIMQFEGWHPACRWAGGSRSWRNRNPGNLRPTNSTQPTDGAGYRKFDSLAVGWAVLLADLDAKFKGSHNLTPQSTMLDLLNVYAPAGDNNNPSAYTNFVCSQTSLALGRTITPTTTLQEYLG